MTNPFEQSRSGRISGRSYEALGIGDSLHIVGSSPTAPDKNMMLTKTSAGFMADYVNAANASRSASAEAMGAGWFYDKAGNLRIGFRDDAREANRKAEVNPKAVRALVDAR